MADDSLSPIKVRVEHKKSVTQDIPDDVTRARNSAWLDVLSPITEWAGLKGDDLRHKRDLFRLEREATLLELSRRLKDKLEGETITQIPTKQLVPALEKASLEAPDSEFVEKWANLLASAARAPGDDVTICTSILSDLGSAEASFLESMRAQLAKNNVWDGDLPKERFNSWHEFMSENYKKITETCADEVEGKVTGEALEAALTEFNMASPFIMNSFNYAHQHRNPQQRALAWSGQQKIAIDVLRYRNLIARDEYFQLTALGAGPHLPGTLTITYYYLTDLAVLFLKRVSSEGHIST